jgi:integrase/recombinase XerC
MMMLINSFLTYLKFEKNYSERTVVSYESDLCEFVKYNEETNENFNLYEVEPEDVRQWMMSLMEKHLKETSVNRKLSALRSFNRYLLLKGKIEKDPTRKIVGPKRKRSLPTFIKIEDMKKILDDDDYADDFEGTRDKMMIEMFYETGMRLSELTSLTDGNVDLISMKIKVTGKRNKQRYIPFGPNLKNKVLGYINVRNAEVVKKCNSFFVRKNGLPVYANLVYNVVRLHLSKVVAIKQKSPHVLRHTFATAMLNNNASLNAVKDLLGHQKLSTTEIYTHTTFEELRKNYKQAHPRA